MPLGRTTGKVAPACAGGEGLSAPRTDHGELLGPLPNGPEADTQPSGDLGMSQATGSEQPSTLQPTFFNSHFSIVPDKNLPFFSKPDERWGCADIPVKLGDIARTQ